MACPTSDIPQTGPFFGVERWFSLGCNPVFKRRSWSQWCIAINPIGSGHWSHRFPFHIGLMIGWSLGSVTIGWSNWLIWLLVTGLCPNMIDPISTIFADPSHPYAFPATFSVFVMFFFLFSVSSRGWALIFSLGPCFSSTARSFWFWRRGNTWHPAFHGDGPAISWTSRLEGLDTINAWVINNPKKGFVWK